MRIILLRENEKIKNLVFQMIMADRVTTLNFLGHRQHLLTSQLEIKLTYSFLVKCKLFFN